MLPGTGSDDDYVIRAFGSPLHAVGASLVAPRPEPRRLVDGYLAALDDAAHDGPIAVGGVSIGAAVSLTWALRHPDRVVAVLAALPPWTGEPGSSPAALAARYSAQQLREHGLTATTTQMRASSPPWLAEELTRSWRSQWPDLPDAMDQAAGYVAPTHAQLHDIVQLRVGGGDVTGRLVHGVRQIRPLAAPRPGQLLGQPRRAGRPHLRRCRGQAVLAQLLCRIPGRQSGRRAARLASPRRQGGQHRNDPIRMAQCPGEGDRGADRHAANRYRAVVRGVVQCRQVAIDQATGFGPRCNEAGTHGVQRGAERPDHVIVVRSCSRQHDESHAAKIDGHL